MYNECEHWGAGSEVDQGAECWSSCEKNRGHKSFIPVKDFGLEHLALEWQREDFVEWIKVYSVLTVRLRVPSGICGENRVGTGFVWKVVRTVGYCPCQQCKGQPSQGSWTFFINTAKHVADDDSEFGMMSVDFYHDDDNSIKAGRMKTLKGGSVVETRDELDWRMFTFICHDEELAVHMMAQVGKREKLYYSLGKWLFSLDPLPVIIVSHPHGRPKCVTIGEGRGIDVDRGMWRYSTDTCRGSSGSVIVGWWRGGPHHCQGGEEDGLNCGFFCAWPDLSVV